MAMPAEVDGRAAVPTERVMGRFATHTCRAAHGYRTGAYLVVPRVAGAVRYTVHASGFDDSAYYGSAITWRFEAAEVRPWAAADDGTVRVQARAAALWLWLSSISGPLARQADATPYFERRFGGMQVVAEVEHAAPVPPA